MDRRTFLAMLAAGGAAALTGCAVESDGEPGRLLASPTPEPGTATTGRPVPTTPAAKPGLPLAGGPLEKKVPIGKTPITALPGRGRHLALTVDDGASSEVVGAYCRWAADSGARFTFFVTGRYDSWRENRAALAPLVESGQVQLGNHTWTHPDLTALGEKDIAMELRRTKRFLKNRYGVDGTPYYRPPFGYRNASVDKVAADLGYTVPTMWEGSIADSGLVTQKFLISMARRYFRPQHIVIGHANHDPVTHVYGKFTDIIRYRRLQTVTLDDYFRT
ncbi:MAG: polysaccharide deacetylase family protein [Gordonia sp. (in: high G+C Gram-positive bacteria)]|uniref:polysaccharide deacetylase family protein n=1 Tax=Gordonia sp. (in: high G+C Gram-positive bacteria) TaxID=84139 RepID=UPI0039E34524